MFHLSAPVTTATYTKCREKQCADNKVWKMISIHSDHQYAVMHMSCQYVAIMKQAHVCVGALWSSACDLQQ